MTLRGTSKGGPAMEPQAIVAATDGSEESLRAVDWAAAEALRRVKPLRLVCVMLLMLLTVRLQLRPERDSITARSRCEREQARVTAATPGPARVRSG